MSVLNTQKWVRASAPGLEGALLQSKRGRLVLVRMAAPPDAPLIAEMLGGLSARSLYMRYGVPMPRMAPEAAAREALRLAEADPRQRLVMLALAREQGHEQVVGVAELARDGGPGVAEIAVVIADALQREGIGSGLCSYLVAAGRRQGITRVRLLALAENAAIRRMVAGSGARYTTETRQGLTTIEIDIAQPFSPSAGRVRAPAQ